MCCLPGRRGMHEAASWFVKNELPGVAKMVKERPGYELLLVGHSLGAGVRVFLCVPYKFFVSVSTGVCWGQAGWAAAEALCQALICAAPL